MTVNRVARWDGTAWSALSGPSGTGVDGPVNALAVFDDGTGPALYAGGDFTTAGGVASDNVAAWRCDVVFADGFESRTTTRWSLTQP